MSLGGPLGAHWDGAGTWLRVFSQHAHGLQVAFFQGDDDGQNAARHPLERGPDQVFSGYFPGIGPGHRYRLFALGKMNPLEGHRFDPNAPLLDPYARAIKAEKDGTKSVLIVDPHFPWEGIGRPAIPWKDTVIYEAHVKGMTQQHPDVPPADRGRFLGLCAPAVVDHLKKLGVTSLQLMPVHHRFDEGHLRHKGLTNYWGYSTLGFFAPDPRFASADDGAQVREFKAMVKGLHKAGIEVLLDVVYNHTAEGNEKGPTLNFRGLDNATYYRLRPEDRARYLDVTGCGNTLNIAHPRVLQMVMDSLRHWVEEMGVDGFRFDLATALARDPDQFSAQSAFFKVIGQDPVLSRVKLIAEPWDLGEGGYRLGQFPTQWSEWNDAYRDSVRRFWRADKGQAAALATRIAGSADIFGARRPQNSINYVACHDGYTLQDLVSYEEKHNQENGEENRDGASANWSRNWGHEGSTDSARIVHLRDRIKRNLMATLAFSRGVPMIGHGDELGRTQKGNNNAYCQDGPLTWINWELDGSQKTHLAFCQQVFALRRAHPAFTDTTFFDGIAGETHARKDVHWLLPDGTEMKEVHWAEDERKFFGMWIARADPPLLVYFNGGSRGVHARLPPPHPHHTWEILVQTCDSTVPPSTRADLHIPPHALVLAAEVKEEP
jgi:glycogen operon protein